MNQSTNQPNKQTGKQPNNQAKPNQTKPSNQANKQPSYAKPSQAINNQTKPNQTKPNQTKPNQTNKHTHPHTHTRIHACANNRNNFHTSTIVQPVFSLFKNIYFRQAALSSTRRGGLLRKAARWASHVLCRVRIKSKPPAIGPQVFVHLQGQAIFGVTPFLTHSYLVALVQASHPVTTCQLPGLVFKCKRGNSRFRFDKGVLQSLNEYSIHMDNICIYIYICTYGPPV